jgi:beta-galactosidase/beta-glucuronidase
MKRRKFLQNLAVAPTLPLRGQAPARTKRELPEGVKAVWDLAKAYRESTRTRERISVNGLWRWQPAAGSADVAPADGWGYLRVPESWPGGGGQRWTGPQIFYPHPSWKKQELGGVTAAWYQREITTPADWAGRRITLYCEYVNSYAVVYVDGKKAGEMRYPRGEVDLTSACQPGRTHLLSMLVVAMPLKAVMLSYNDTASARQVAGRVGRRGLCGDVYLVSTPAGPRITDVKVDTSVRRWQITFDAALAELDEKARYVLRAQIRDGSRQVEEFTSRSFAASDLKNGRILLTEHWRPEKLWDTHTPQNQYDLSLSLLDAGGRPLDTALPVRFGFREFWIEGRDFYLNGTRIFLSAIPLDNGQLGPTSACYDGTRATLQRFKSFGINFVYTHNYGCEPGAHISFEEVLKAADDEGMLLSFSQPHFGHYDWEAPDADETNGYARHAEFYVRVAQNHPSVVCYSTSHNSTGYSEDMNPEMIDGIQNPRDPWALRNAGRALRVEAIIRRIDPSRFVYHHSSGNLGTMHTINFYANWAPIQEMSEWFEHWATFGVKPVFTCEYSVPFLWDWSMYRGWYKGKREFGSAVAPWEFCVAEWNAQFLGDRSYQVMEEEKANLRWEAEQFRKGRAWQRFDYPSNLNSQVFEERFRVVAMHLSENFRAFRTLGVSATSPWEYGVYWKPQAYERGHSGFEFEVDWERLQRPGPRAVYVREEEARARLAFRASQYQATVAAQALYRNNMPLLAYLAGKPAAFTSKDHNFLPGEAVEKQLIVINNMRRNVSCDCEWSLGLPQAIAGNAKVTLPTGQQERIPLSFALPADLAPGRYDLHARVRFDSGETQQDTFSIDVMPRPAAPRVAAKIALFDPKGETAKLLDGLGVRCDRVNATGSLSGYDTLIIGKGALTLDGAAPDIAGVREGLKVIVFEQTGEVLEKRFGFRVAEYGMRWVFKRVPDHPLLAGLADEHLRDWRGEATILPPRLTYERAKQFNYVPTVNWCGIPVTRLWRCGHRGNVASALIEKPACGDFLPILDCGYALQYSPLVEYREGKGMVLFCQMDVNGRTETDPAAQALARNILGHVSSWKPGAQRRVVYAGDPAGQKHLESAGFSPAAYQGGRLSADQVLVVGPGGGQKVAAHAAGQVIAIGLDEKDANAFLPRKVTMARQEHIAAYFEPFPAGSPFAGVSPAEVHNRSPRDLPLVVRGATVVGNGVLARAEDANVVFCQLAPWTFDYSGAQMNIKRTFRRVSCLTARLLANLGAAAQTPLLARMARPVRENEKRWLDGLYLDPPEEWDDPYRFFRW